MNALVPPVVSECIGAVIRVVELLALVRNGVPFCDQGLVNRQVNDQTLVA